MKAQQVKEVKERWKKRQKEENLNLGHECVIHPQEAGPLGESLKMLRMT